MDIQDQQQRGWLYTCSPEDRLAVFGVIHGWAREIGDRTDLDPLASRVAYRDLAGEIADVVTQEHGQELQTGPVLRRQWGRLGAATQATWVRAVGPWLDSHGPGPEAAQIVSSSLVPPRFGSLDPGQQQHLIWQIATEVESYLEDVPGWYGKAEPLYRILARALRGVEMGGTVPDRWSVRWDHLEGPQRGRLLQEVGLVAQRSSNGLTVPDYVRPHLYDLANSATRIAGLHLGRALERGGPG